MPLLATLLATLALTPAPDSARPVLQAALAAHGMSARAPDGVTASFSGVLAMRGQSRGVDGPLDWEPARTTTTWDARNDRIAQDAENTYPVGFVLTYRTVVTPDTGFVIELTRWLQGAMVDRGAATPRPAVRATLLRELGPFWIEHALAHGTALRRLGDERDGARTYQVVSLDDGAGEIAAGFDARTHLLAWLETRAQHPVTGLERTRVTFAGYRSERARAGMTPLRLPTLRVDTRNGVESQRGLIAWTLGAAPPDSLFAVPAGYHENHESTEPLRPLADGVWALRITTGYTAMVVEFDHFLAVMEAPINSALSERALRAIAERFPEKPVRYVAFTHHHTDHAGGLRPYIARGVTVLATPAESAFVERLAAVELPLQPDSLSRAPRRPIFETFTGARRVRDGARELDLYDMGATSHASSMVFAYVPGAGIAYDGDATIFPPDVTDVPVNPLTGELLRAFRDAGIADSVTTIVGTHVGPVPVARLTTPR
ncbi:MAG TPA: MBL fold metallo-hydrolase [Gemmatimonadaceae bacterium]